MSRRAPGVSGVILAGGLARRMAGADKGLQRYDGRVLIEHVIERFAPQVDEILINANRHADEYARFGYAVVADRFAEFPGPLAGIHAALGQARHDLLAVVPCDAPRLPLDLVARLLEAVEHRDMAIARSPEGLQPVFCLCRRGLLPSLETFLVEGGRRMQDWCTLAAAAIVDFDRAEEFANINTIADLNAASGLTP